MSYWEIPSTKVECPWNNQIFCPSPCRLSSVFCVAIGTLLHWIEKESPSTSDEINHLQPSSDHTQDSPLTRTQRGHLKIKHRRCTMTLAAFSSSYDAQKLFILVSSCYRISRALHFSCDSYCKRFPVLFWRVWGQKDVLTSKRFKQYKNRLKIRSR